MEVSVRRIFAREQQEVALCFRGRKWANCVVVDYPIRVFTMDIRAMEKSPTLQYQGKPYPITRIAKKLLEFGKTHDITVAAERLCKAALDGVALDEETIDAKPSENGASEPVKVRKTKKTKSRLAEQSNEMATEANEFREAVVAAVERGSSPGRGNLVAELSKKYKIEAKDARKALRKAGLAAPYTDAAKIEAVLAKVKK